MHVPKTGGTSLDAALAKIYAGAREGNVGFGRITQAWQLVKEHEDRENTRWSHVINTALCFRMASGAPYLSGHFCVSRQLIDETRPPYRYITLFRDPTDRWISNYVYSRIREAQDGNRAVPADIKAELRAYLMSPTAHREGAKYVFALGGHQREDALLQQSTIDYAKRTIEAFDAIGFLDQLPIFEDRLTEMVGRRVKISHLRKTKDFKEPGERGAEDYKALFTRDVRDEVKALCQPDYQIYNYARTLPIAL